MSYKLLTSDSTCRPSNAPCTGRIVNIALFSRSDMLFVTPRVVKSYFMKQLIIYSGLYIALWKK